MDAPGGRDALGNPKLFNPFKHIPNVESYEVGSRLEDDPLWTALGEQRTLRAEATYKPYLNGKMNKYILYNVRRLSHKLDHPLVFWKIAGFLMRRSEAFLLLALNHC